MTRWQIINNKPVMRTGQQVLDSKATGYVFNDYKGHWMKLYRVLDVERCYKFERVAWLYVDSKEVPESIRLSEMLRSE